jgi:hypothetical protein
VDDHHPEFQGSIDPAHKEELFVGRWLESRGNLDVIVHEKRIAPTLADRAEYADSGDLQWMSKSGRLLHGEVKAIRHNFTHDRGKWEWPDRVFVDRVETYDAKDPRPDWYFIVSADRQALATVNVIATRQHWDVHDVQHRLTKIWNPTYCTTLEHIGLHDLRDFERGVG